MVGALPQLLRLECGGEPLSPSPAFAQPPFEESCRVWRAHSDIPSKDTLFLQMDFSCVPGAVLCAEDTTRKETDKSPALMELTFGWESKPISMNIKHAK